MSDELYQMPDISQFQGNVNFKAVRTAGYPAVILRAGWGQNNRDAKYEYNATACRNLGIKTAIYWFSYALTDDAVRKEAEYAIKAAEEYWPDAPIAFDLEYDSRSYAAKRGVNMGREMITRHAIIFLSEIAKTAHKPILYTNRDYIRNYFDLPKIREEIPQVSIWFACYTNSVPAELQYSDIWQYTSRGAITGISGAVDINKVYKDIFQESTDPPANKTESPNLYIKEFQHAANLDGYRDDAGKSLIEDGIDGAKTQAARKKIRLKTSTGDLWITRSTGSVVGWLQKRLMEQGMDLTCTGEYDAATVTAVTEFQKKYNLTVDGIAGYNTIQTLFYT